MAKLSINVERIVTLSLKHNDNALQFLRLGKWKKAEQCLINEHNILPDKEYFTKERFPEM